MIIMLVQISSVTQSCPTLCNPTDCSMPGPLSITNSRSLLKLMPIESVMPFNHLILCHPLSSCLQSCSASGSFQMSHVVTSGGQSIKSFRFSISPCNEYSGLISFRMDWLALLAVQGTLKSLLQYHSSKASILQHSAFCIVQLSHPYMTIGKTIALTRWTFVGKGTLIIVFFWSVFSKCLMFKIGDKLQAGPIQTKSPNFNTFKLSSLFK